MDADRKAALTDATTPTLRFDAETVIADLTISTALEAHFPSGRPAFVSFRPIEPQGGYGMKGIPLDQFRDLCRRLDHALRERTGAGLLDREAP